MGLNGEFVSDINHLGLAYLPLRVTIDVKRGEDSFDTGNKREGNKKKKKGGIRVDCDKDNARRKRNAVKPREGRTEMRKDNVNKERRRGTDVK